MYVKKHFYILCNLLIFIRIEKRKRFRKKHNYAYLNML
jgi:hypothetical protein